MTSLLELIKDLQATPGTLNKKALLRSYEDISELQSFLYRVYNPYKQYKISSTRIPENTPEAGDTEELSFIYCLVDDFSRKPALMNRDLVHLDRVWRDITPDLRELLRYILTKDLKAGINIKTINSVFPGLIPEFPVMLAQKIDWDRVQYPCYSSPKLDGVRCLYHRGMLFTRSGRQIIGCSHISDALDQLQKELVEFEDMWIDGELIIPGENFDKGSGRIRSHNDCPEAELHVFDVRCQKDYSFKDRMGYFIVRSLRSGSFSPQIKIVPHVMCFTKSDVMENHKKYLVGGLEGSIIKPLDYKFEAKRSYHWMKIKGQESFDLECVGFYEGKGKYEGMLGGIKVIRNGVTINVGGGFSDAERKEIWENKQEYLGATAEVYGQQLTESGSIRHPDFLRWRWDLD